MSDLFPAPLVGEEIKRELGQRIQNRGCRGECEEIHTRVWIDNTTFIPFGPKGAGICELRATQYEVSYCRQPSSPDCRPAYRQIVSRIIATKGVNNERQCGKHAFRPYHRTGVEADVIIADNKRFGRSKNELNIERRYLASGFVQNFDPDHMYLFGANWLTIDKGYLIGVPPIVESAQDFPCSLTATNNLGFETVTLIVRVVPN